MGKTVSIQFDSRNGPLYIKLAQHLEKMIKSSKIQSGERLPSVRGLAQEWKVNTSTVVAAYRYLEEKGLVYTKPGSGTYCLPQSKAVMLGGDLDGHAAENAGLGNGKLIASDDFINLAGNSPIAEVFPVSEFKSAINEVLDSDGGYAFSYLESEGYPPLREILSVFSNENYEIRCTPGNILITSGAQQALDIIGKAVLRPGDTMLAEMPSYIGMRSVFSMHGAKILGVPIENDGINLDIVEFYAKRYNPRLLYTMPVYQTPTGVCLSAEKRKRLLKISEKYDFYIIEDDLFSDINLLGDRMLPLKSWDDADRVIYVKSFSKLLMPGIRTGYVIVPRRLFDKMAAVKYATDISGSSLIQRALAVYFKKGCWNKNIGQLSDVYKKRLGTAVKITAEWKRFGVDFNDVKGGFGMWITLPEGLTDRKIFFLCKERHVLVAPGSLFYISPMAGYDRHLKLSFASTDQLEKGLAITGDCIKSAVNKSSDRVIFI